MGWKKKAICAKNSCGQDAGCDGTANNADVFEQSSLQTIVHGARFAFNSTGIVSDIVVRPIDPEVAGSGTAFEIERSGTYKYEFVIRATNDGDEALLNPLEAELVLGKAPSSNSIPGTRFAALGALDNGPQLLVGVGHVKLKAGDILGLRNVSGKITQLIQDEAINAKLTLNRI